MEVEHAAVGSDLAVGPVAENGVETATHAELIATSPGGYHVMRRNGKVTAFDGDKIKVALTKAFLAVEGGNAAASSRIHELVDTMTEQIVNAITRRLPGGGTIHIEDIQDQVELALMRCGEHKVAREYVLYREARNKERADQPQESRQRRRSTINVVLPDGSKQPLDEKRLRRLVAEACEDIELADPDLVVDETMRNVFDGIAEDDVGKALIMCARSFIEKEPNYTQVASRLLLDTLRKEALSFISNQADRATQEEMAQRYAHYFEAYVKRAIDLELMDSRLGNYDLEKIGRAIKPERAPPSRPVAGASRRCARSRGRYDRGD